MVDAVSVGDDRMRRNFELMRKQVEVLESVPISTRNEVKACLRLWKPNLWPGGISITKLGRASSQTQLAEILLSGLVQRTTTADAKIARDWVEYRFHPEPAKVLVRGLRESDAQGSGCINRRSHSAITGPKTKAPATQ